MAQEMDSLSPLLGGDPNDIQSTFYAPEPSDLTGGLPINLDSLRDGPPGSKPFYPYSTLIRYVLEHISANLRGLMTSVIQLCYQGFTEPKAIVGGYLLCHRVSSMSLLQSYSPIHQHVSF